MYSKNNNVTTNQPLAIFRSSRACVCCAHERLEPEPEPEPEPEANPSPNPNLSPNPDPEPPHPGNAPSPTPDLFIAEIAEGSGYNKYIEIFNPTSAAISLDGYYFGSVGNAPTTLGQYEYQNTFATGATVGPGDVYIVCHGSADAAILAECDEPSWTYLSNGDDAYCLLKGDATATTCEVIDCVGDFQGDPGSGWDVCGVSAATQDKTLVRRADADFVAATAAGVGSSTPTQAIWTYTSVTDCQWDIYDKDTWTYLGSHTVTGAGVVAQCVGSVGVRWRAQSLSHSSPMHARAREHNPNPDPNPNPNPNPEL